MKKTIGIGVIGLQDGEALLAVNDDRTTRLRVAAVCSSSPGTAAKIAERYDILHYTADHVDMLPIPALDAAAIFSPARDHYDHILAALVANRHVMCTQPIADSLKGALDLAVEADRRGRKVLLWHPDRWDPDTEGIHALAHSGALGDLRVLDVTVALPAPPKSQGRRKATPPLDAVSDGLSRAADLLQWFAGEVTAVTAMGRGEPPETLIVHLQFSGGAMGRVLVLNGSSAQPVSLDVYGGKGSVVNGSVVLDAIHGRPAMTFQPVNGSKAEEGPLLRCARHFEECLTKDARPVVDHWDAVRTVAVCDAARRSLVSGRSECVPPAGREQEYIEGHNETGQG
jgi:predicted dehydrogenase